MMVRRRFSAPAWPPETGASMKPRPRLLAFSDSSLATLAEVVVWSTKTAPDFIPAKLPLSPKVTARKSSSLPTQEKIKSAPAVAARGVEAALALKFLEKRSAFTAVRL